MESLLTIDNLEVGGHVKLKRDWWPDRHSALSVAIQDIVIRRPEVTITEEPAPTDPGTTDETPRRPWERAREDNQNNSGTGGDEWPRTDEYPNSYEGATMPGGCTVAQSSEGMAGGGLLPVLFTLAVMVRRRRR